MNPEYPLLWFGEDCGVMHFQNENELSTTELMPFGPITFEDDHVIDINGQEWKLSLKSTEKISFLKKLKVLLGHQIKTVVKYDFIQINKLDLEKIKEKLINYSRADPGDLMQQFIPHEEIVEKVTKANSITELYEFVRNNICEENEA